MKSDGIYEMGKDTTVLLRGMLLSEEMGCMSSCGIHTDVGQEGIPIHTTNKGGALTFSIGWGYHRGLKGEDHLLEACSKA